jgi:hypothetical protein
MPTGRNLSRMKPAFKHRRKLTLLTVVAFVLTTLAGGFVRAPAHAAGYVDPVLGVVTLCTPGAITADSGDLPDQRPPAEHCPLCTLLTPPAIAPTQSCVPVAFPNTSRGTVPARAVATGADHLHLGGVGSRAPPRTA